MPEYKFYTKRHLEAALRMIGEASYVEVAPLTIQAWCTHEPVSFEDRCTGEPRALSLGDTWGTSSTAPGSASPGRFRQKQPVSTLYCC